MNDNDHHDGWVFPTDKPCYQPYIVGLMGHHLGQIFPRNQTFTRQQLLTLTPLAVRKWMCNAAFGKDDIAANDRPTHGRSSSLAMMKKCVSHYMPNKGPSWCNGQGNPTKSEAVNSLIRLVKKFEVRGEGKDSQAKRPLRQDEFLKTLELLKRKPDFKHRYRYPTMCLWQYHLIARSDDVCNFKTTDPRGHPQFDFAIKTKVRWSKNVNDERSCPDQILLGAMDPKFCILLTLGLYLEEYLRQHPNARYLFTERDGRNAVKNLRSTFRQRLEKVVWVDEEFDALVDVDDEEGIGTHSYRKFPTTYACGANPDEVDH